MNKSLTPFEKIVANWAANKSAQPNWVIPV